MHCIGFPADRLYSFRCNFADCRNASEIKIGDNDELSILFRLQHTGGTHVCSDMHPQSLPWLMAGNQADLPEFKKTGEPKVKKAKRTDDPVLDMPWLEHLNTKSGFEMTFDALKAAHKKASRSGSSADDDELDEDMMLAELADLDKARSAAAEEQAASGIADFVSKVRGGESQILASGEAVHAMQGQSLKWGYAWAKRRNLHVTFKATFSQHEEAVSKILCRSWCHRMQYFYNVEVAAAEGPDLVYRPELVAAYVEPTELTALALDPATKPVSADAVAKIRKIPFP